ncbi:MAG: hypothetical protein R3C56_06840 [Pirellulaceae bacterium]
MWPDAPPSVLKYNKPNFEGPIVCEVSPDAELYVGNLHDSGWGEVRTRARSSALLLPATCRWGSPRSAQRLTDSKSTSLKRSTATRQRSEQLSIAILSTHSTPAYGGDDQDQRNESIQSVSLTEDRRRVTLELKSLRAGFVYELNIAPLGADGTALFPSQAHYSMRVSPLRNSPVLQPLVLALAV